jgi:hypothetical protein
MTYLAAQGIGGVGHSGISVPFDLLLLLYDWFGDDYGVGWSLQRLTTLRAGPGLPSK